MEEDMHKESPQPEFSVDNGDMKYVSGLSTILVATIQEAKDRISQIEYIFCSQLFPNFQSNHKTLHKVYITARKAAEDAWRDKEKGLLLQIEKLQREKKLAMEENDYLKQDKAKLVNIDASSVDTVHDLQNELKQKTDEIAEGRKYQDNLLKHIELRDSVICAKEKLLSEHEEKNNLFIRKQRILELEAEELRQELSKKSKEVDGGMELQNKLLHLVQSKASSILDKEKHLKEHEERINELLAKHKILEEGVDELNMKLREKNKEVEREKELKENLLKNFELQESKMVNYEQLLNGLKKEKELLMAKLEISKQHVDELEKELMKHRKELEVGIEVHEQLVQQRNLCDSELLKTRQQMEELDKDKKLLLSNLEGLDEKVRKLQLELKMKSNESTEGMELHGKLLQQIELKESELLAEKKKRKDVIDAYKNLKSQYNFLRAKFGLTSESKLPQNRLDENDSLRNNQNLITSPDTESKVLSHSIVCEITKEKDVQENMEDCKGDRAIPDSPASTSSPIVPKFPVNEKSGSLVGSKRPVSRWRETRSKHNRVGPDPHDDFLDTPLENIRGNLKKDLDVEFHNPPGPAPKDMIHDSSDDETQDISVDLGPQKQQTSPPRPGAKDYKFVEPVRKKAERENLKGVECKQCKKFYDAVLPDGGGTDGNKQNLRCEHHEGVSRHRYRYAPPLTPEGFWNIGFESEM